MIVVDGIQSLAAVPTLIEHVDAAARCKAGAFTSAGPIDRASHRQL